MFEVYVKKKNVTEENEKKETEHHLGVGVLIHNSPQYSTAL